MNTDTAEIGVILGRFQTPFLHEGHREVIQHVIDHHPRVFVFLGQSPLKCTQNDPLDFNTRRAMLEEAFPDIEVHRIDDVGDDTRWSRELDRQIGLLAGPGQKVVLYGSRDSFLKAYKGHYATEELRATHHVSATEIRRRIGVKSKKSQAFREGAVWAMQNRWPSVLACVDIAVVEFFPDSGSCRVLLGKKPTDTLWRFPGGFSDIISSSFEEDAKRELLEETHLVATDITYIGSHLIDDWRYRSQVDKIKTLFFVVRNWDGVAEAGDDLSEVKWWHYEEIHPEILVPNHRVLLNFLVNWKEQINNL
jgi:bifunctional NMN adenylyltransferase/nudix hydrolase